MSELKLSLLGPFQASLENEPIHDFRTRKVQALLILVAMESDGHSRDRLLNLLWPGLPEKSARSNLRQVLYYLKRDLPTVPGHGRNEASVIIANRHEIRLNPRAAVAVDTWQFEGLLDEVRAHDHLDLFLCGECAARLEQAVILYRGDFLTDFYLDDSNEFEEWAQGLREYFRRKVLDALSNLTTITIRARDFATAESYAERQLEIDNLREGAYRQLMEVLALSGRREQALAVYDTCRRMLAEELGMAPAARTTEYYEKILADDLHFERFERQDIHGYELKEQIAEGSYGTVYRAVQPAISRQVAVKVIQRKYADNPEFIRRFEAEAQVIAQLEHPHIVPLYDYWRNPEGAYLVMRYMDGGSLLEQLREGPWNAGRAAAMLDQIADALAIAHQKDIVHRDIKPANILMDPAGNAYLADFGIARRLSDEGPLVPDDALPGTLDYVSPEQITDEMVTPRSDIYSLGAVLFETLTGERPYGDATLSRLLYSHLHEPIPLVTATRPDMPPEVDRVLQKATAKNPAERYATPLEMAAAFRRALSGTETETEEWSGPTVPALVEVYNPYKGLQAFGESDTEDFFGRETLVEQLLARLAEPAGGRESRFLAVVGPSGSGKSSVVKAGLIPALRQGSLPGSEKWFITEMTPGSNPLEELELALWRVAVNPPPNLVEPMRRDSGGILRTIRRILPAERESRHGRAQLLLIIDQFEELFTLVEDEQQRLFFLDSLLAAMRAPRSPLRVVVTLRADFYDRPLQYEDWGGLIKQNTEVVLPLNRSELTWAVREPARRMGVGLEEGLTAAIVADVADQPGALPLMQYAMTELFERQEGRQMTRAAYDQLGGVSGALGQRAEVLFGDLPESGQQIARQIFLRLITLGEGVEDTRRRVPRSELEALSGTEEEGGGPSLIAEVLDRFGEARFLTFDRDPLTRAPTVEVAHEALLREWARLRGWLDDSRADVRLQRLLAQAVREWQAAGRDAGYLLRDARLDQFAGWAEDSPLILTDDERALIAASAAAREERLAAEEERRQQELRGARQLAETQQKRAEEQAQAAKRLRRRAVYLAGALVIAGLLAVLAFAANRQSILNAAEAQANAERADANAVEAQANADVAATSAAESAANAALAQTREAEEALQRAVAQEAQATAEAARLVADQERALAEQQVRLTTSRELSLAALNTLDEDPELSILLALQALESAYSREAEDALHRAVQQSRLRQAIPGVKGAVYHPDGTQVATISETELQVWDLDTERVALTVALPAEPAGLAYSPDGRTIATGHADGRLLLWDAASGAGLGELEGHTDWVSSIDFSPDGERLASTAAEGVAILWDLDSGEPLFTFPGVVLWDSVVSFSPDGALLAVPEIAEGQNTRDGIVNVWDTTSGALRLTVGGVNYPAFSPDGAYLAITDGNFSNVIVWDLAASLAAGRGEPATSLVGHESLAAVGAFSPDGAHVATCSLDSTAKLWDVQTGREQFTLTGHSGGVGSCAFSPDGQYLLTHARDGARIWDITLPGNVEVKALAGSGIDSGSVALSPDGAYLALGSGTGNTYLYEVTGGDLLAVLSSHSQGVTELAFGPSGERLATASEDGTVKVWDVAGSLASGRGQELLTLRGHGEGIIGGVVSGVADVAFSPDGQRLATGGADGTVRLWDAGAGDLLATLRVYPDESGIWSVAFSPDGQYLAASSEIPFQDGVVKVWRLAGEQIEEALTLDGFTDRIRQVEFSPDGKRLLTSGNPPALWDSQSGELVRSFAGHPSGVTSVALSADGGLVATSGRDRVLRVFDAASGENLLAIDTGPRSGGPVFGPEGKYIYTAERASVYALELETLISLAHERLTRWWRPEECQQYLHSETCPQE